MIFLKVPPHTDYCMKQKGCQTLLHFRIKGDQSKKQDCNQIFLESRKLIKFPKCHCINQPTLVIHKSG